MSTVYLSVQLSNKVGGALAVADRDRVYRPVECDLHRIIGVLEGEDETPLDERILRSVEVRESPRETPATNTVPVSAASLVWNTSYWIQRTLVEFPEAIVVLTARLPKTVAFRLGWFLGNSRLHFDVVDAARPVAMSSPWERLVPMYFDDPSQRLVPMWVRHDQTNPGQLLRCAGMGDAPQGEGTAQ